MDQETPDEEYPKAAFWLLAGCVVVVIGELVLIGWIFLRTIS